MSTGGTALSLREARILADRIVGILTPVCTRIEIAGSIRRGKPWVNDIEIVLTPKTTTVQRELVIVEGDIFTGREVEYYEELVRDPAYEAAVLKLAETVVRGAKISTAKYTQITIEGGVKVDLFTARPENWGYILAIRTGPAEYSQGLLGRGNRLGFKGVDGMWTRNGMPVNVPEERTVFDLLGINYTQPSDR